MLLLASTTQPLAASQGPPIANAAHALPSSKACPAGQPSAGASVTQIQLPQLFELMSESQVEPTGHVEPPQVWSQMQSPVSGSQTLPTAHSGHCGSQRPVTGLQASPSGQPPQVGSTTHCPQKILRHSPRPDSQTHESEAPLQLISSRPEQPALLSQTRPVGQEPPQLVSHTHSPQLAESTLESQYNPGAQLKPQVVSHTQLSVSGS